MLDVPEDDLGQSLASLFQLGTDPKPTCWRDGGNNNADARASPACRQLLLKARHVGDLQLGVYASPSYLERAGVPTHPDELESSHHRIVVFLWGRSSKPLPYAMRRDGERINVHGRYVVSVDDGNAYLAAGLAGMGVLWLPNYMSQPYVTNGELVALFRDWRLDSMPLYLAFPPKRHVSAKLRVFIDWIVELMARHAPITKRSDA